MWWLTQFGLVKVERGTGTGTGTGTGKLTKQTILLFF